MPMTSVITRTKTGHRRRTSRASVDRMVALAIAATCANVNPFTIWWLPIAALAWWIPLLATATVGTSTTSASNPSSSQGVIASTPRKSFGRSRSPFTPKAYVAVSDFHTSCPPATGHQGR
jgi:hypothetical protein